MDIFKKIRKLDLPLDEYIVIGGSAMEVYGIRESNDIDICITEELFEDLKELGWKETIKSDGLKVLNKDNVEAATKWGYGKYDLSVSSQLDASEIVNGIRVMSLQELLNYKNATGREKDALDARLIQKFIEKNGKDK